MLNMRYPEVTEVPLFVRPGCSIFRAKPEKSVILIRFENDVVPKYTSAAIASE
jgi:hypothetical protein